MEDNKPTREEKIVAFFFLYMQTAFAIIIFALSATLVIAHLIKGHINFALLLMSAMPVIGFYLMKLAFKELKEEKIKYSDK